MARVKITPHLAPTPRITMWVPLMISGALSLILLGILKLVQR